MKIINARSAGIEIGSRIHLVAVDQKSENVRHLEFTRKISKAMIEWLKLHFPACR